MKLDDELNELTPWLLDLKKQDDGFRTPDGYFDRLEGEVLQQLDAIGARRRPKAAERPASWWSRLLQPRFALAFGLLLTVAAAAWWLLRPQGSPLNDTDAPLATVELTPEEAEAYLLENLAEFDPDHLAEALKLEEPLASEPTQPAPSKKATPAKPSSEELDPLLDELSDEELEDLL